jgi:predicted transposase/invertase (TIGR01784 family)
MAEADSIVPRQPLRLSPATSFFVPPRGWPTGGPPRAATQRLTAPPHPKGVLLPSHALELLSAARQPPANPRAARPTAGPRTKPSIAHSCEIIHPSTRHETRRPPVPVRRLDPKLDIVFKLMLTRKRALLRDMLQGVLARRVGVPTIINPGIPGELVRSKHVVLDVRVVLDDGSRADLEMQLRTPPTLASRLVYYGARDYADQLVRGDDYHLLEPTAVITWLAKPLFPTLGRLHSIFELRERHTHMLFSEHLTFHVLQLSEQSSLSPSPANRYDAQVARWARFLTARDDAELEQLASENRIMSLAKETLEQLSQDPEVRRLARERADEIKLYNMDIAVTRAEGRQEGRKEARAEVLLKLLGLRFGRLSKATRARVQAAAPNQLDTWIERVLTAQTIDKVFAP